MFDNNHSERTGRSYYHRSSKGTSSPFWNIFTWDRVVILEVQELLNLGLDWQQTFDLCTVVDDRNLVLCLMSVSVQVAIDGHLHLVLELLKGCAELGRLKFVVPKGGRSDLASFTDLLLDEEFGEGREHAHHEGEHVPEDELVPAVVVGDGPEHFDGEQEEAVRGVKRDRDLAIYLSIHVAGDGFQSYLAQSLVFVLGCLWVGDDVV